MTATLERPQPATEPAGPVEVSDRSRAERRLGLLLSAPAVVIMFGSQSGFINSWFGLSDFAWFSHRASSLFVIIVSEIWKTTPFISLLLLAGLAQVPAELDEAAAVDGGTWWQRLWKVTVPTMKG